MSRVANKVAFITGAARGQGRAIATRLAQEGADIIAVDLVGPMDAVPYPLSTPDDLAETVRLVEAADRRIIPIVGDVRDQLSLDAAVAEGVKILGRLDIVAANAGIFILADSLSDVTEAQWAQTIAVNLTGVWHTVKATVPAIIEAGNGGSLILTSSLAGLRGFANAAPYVASKHGVMGLMKTLAIDLAPHRIRVNTINPTTVRTPMVVNEPSLRFFRPDLDHPTLEDVAEGLRSLQLLDIPWVETEDIANAALWLASDESRYVTGISIPVDGGAQWQ
jgi:(+)-trans-carveol dehydrogenase